ncbi:hypothetical protein HHK36_010016 [Tetracentron sinense]|uniref:Zinc-finger domain-containing protein n=1 Tax=Tetracentron sinense TaxID=13715 RepID=A0A835DIQ3_TETSI|nr:hypothetical protein HHK36_010016 [Tetracentron sinense]
MVTPRKRARILETPASPKQINNQKTQPNESDEISGYEQFRDKRIKENMLRMQKLGIIDLSQKLKSELLPPKRTLRKQYKRRTPSSSSRLSYEPPRRSSRLQNATQVSYSERRKLKISIRECLEPEIYTEEHDKLLGHCETSWTLFVDGYGEDGKRIYDLIKGKTCHQCRQKTLGHHTHCIKCSMVQGQFCGDCLYMRYGENVLEANQNPSWICPVCRGICNCSLCRQSKGWLPTGALYRKISLLGFKSVAHYLIQTRRIQMNSEKDPGTDNSFSVKRSLPFADMEAPYQQKESLDSDDGHHGFSISQSGDEIDDDEIKGEKDEVHCLDSKYGDSNVASASSPKLKMKPALATESSPDSIAGRLRQWLNKDDGEDGCSKPESVDSKDDGKGEEEQTLDHKQFINNIVSESSRKHNMKPSLSTKPSLDCLTGRLRPRRNAS